MQFFLILIALFVKSLKKGDKIGKEDVKSIRPGYGLKPKNLERVLTKKTNQVVKVGDRVTWDKLS